MSKRACVKLTFDICDYLKNDHDDEFITKIARNFYNTFKHQKTPFWRIILNQRFPVPIRTLNCKFLFASADPSKILNEGRYKLTSCAIKYDTIISPVLCNTIEEHYDISKVLPFRGLSWLKQGITVVKSLHFLLIVTWLWPIKGKPGAVNNSGMKTADLLTGGRKTSDI